MTTRCSLATCFDPEVVGCKVGELNLGNCANWCAPSSAQESESSDSNELSSTRFPWTGNALGEADLAFLTGHCNPRLIAIMGAESAGKTSLLAALYLLLGRGIHPPAGTFAGSLTLEGWENIAASLRWSSPQGPSFPPHTSSGTGRQPGLLHLTMSLSGTNAQLLFADAPGEWFSRWAVHRDAADAAGAKWLATSADVLLVVADSNALTGEQRGIARSRLFELLRRTGAESGGRPTALVWTKSDVTVSSTMVSAVHDMADRTLGAHQVFHVSMHPKVGYEGINQGQGLIELFEWLLTVRDKCLPVISRGLAERELFNLHVGAHRD